MPNQEYLLVWCCHICGLPLINAFILGTTRLFPLLDFLFDSVVEVSFLYLLGILLAFDKVSVPSFERKLLLWWSFMLVDPFALPILATERSLVRLVKVRRKSYPWSVKLMATGNEVSKRAMHCLCVACLQVPQWPDTPANHLDPQQWHTLGLLSWPLRDFRVSTLVPEMSCSFGGPSSTQDACQLSGSLTKTNPIPSILTITMIVHHCSD